MLQGYDFNLHIMAGTWSTILASMPECLIATVFCYLFFTKTSDRVKERVANGLIYYNREVEEDEIRLVGLSALMTTTLPAMEETIRLLHTLKNPPVIMVGGAVVTPEYALHMQADYYAKDAREAAEIAKIVLG